MTNDVVLLLFTIVVLLTVILIFGLFTFNKILNRLESIENLIINTYVKVDSILEQSRRF